MRVVGYYELVKTTHFRGKIAEKGVLDENVNYYNLSNEHFTFIGPN